MRDLEHPCLRVQVQDVASEEYILDVKLSILADSVFDTTLRILLALACDFSLNLQCYQNIKVAEVYHYHCTVGDFSLYVHEGFKEDPLATLIKVYSSVSGT